MKSREGLQSYRRVGSSGFTTGRCSLIVLVRGPQQISAKLILQSSTLFGKQAVM